jgi:hypothetical protein
MTHPLDGAQRKVERAREHLQALQADVRTVTNANPYGFVTELEEKTGHYVVRARQYVEWPARVGLVAGDVVHNLRSVLDHLAFQLAERGKGADRHTAWPIVADSKDYGSQEGLLLKGVLKGHRARIKALQPYKARDAIAAGNSTAADFQNRWTAHIHTLVIGRLDNLDKHRSLLPLVGVSKAVPPTFRGVRRAKGEYPAGYVRMEHGAELFRITEIELLGAPEDVEVETPPTYNILFGDPEYSLDQLWTDRSKGAASVTDLFQATDSVERIVRGFWDDLSGPAEF